MQEQQNNLTVNKTENHRIGRIAWNKGLNASDETKRKMRLSMLGKNKRPLSIETKIKLSKARKGIKLSNEVKEKISVSQKKHYENNPHIAIEKSKKAIENRENCNFWKGGITKESRLIRERCDIVNWRKKIYERDNYICQVCFSRGVNLNAHHIFSLVSYPKKRTEIKNGLTMCVCCHNEFHNRYGRGSNTDNQLKEFMEDINAKNRLRLAEKF